ncbi:MAG: aquaporin [Verrucomicrobiae bacterium]|nr:aquaporin [Verrucomicrobiae bacterium]MCP5541805.1 aquaporin [Akkermansiaceae bacterium]
MKKIIVEFIGTFFLVFTVGTAAMLGNAGDLAPLAIGSVLMVMIFAGGHISGAHYNPAVSLAVMLRGKLNAKDLGPYLGAQLIAGVLAGVLVQKVINGDNTIPSLGDIDMRNALLAEFLFTFALCYVVLNVATTEANKGNSFYGLAIGFTVMSGAFAVGKISGGVFNPAVGVSLFIYGALPLKTLFFYLVAQIAGAALADIVFKKTAL